MRKYQERVNFLYNLIFRNSVGRQQPTLCRQQWHYTWYMKTSSDGSLFCVTGSLWGEFIGHRWIPLTKGPVMRTMIILWRGSAYALKQSNGRWFETNLCSCDVIVMSTKLISKSVQNLLLESWRYIPICWMPYFEIILSKKYPLFDDDRGVKIANMIYFGFWLWRSQILRYVRVSKSIVFFEIWINHVGLSEQIQENIF